MEAGTVEGEEGETLDGEAEEWETRESAVGCESKFDEMRSASVELIRVNVTLLLGETPDKVSETLFPLLK